MESGCPGLHNLFYPTIRDGSTWSKFRACGEHGDVFLLSLLLHLLMFRYSLHICLREVKNSFSSDTLIYGISRNASKSFNIRTCEHMILGQLSIGAR